MITVTGWKWEYIDDCMTIPRLLAMQRYWGICPPVHISFQRLNSALLKPAEGSETSSKETKGDLNSFIQDFMAQGGQIGVENG